MAQAITLGRMTDTMEEGFLAELTIKTGDTIKAGDTLAEVETDKATLPLESYFNGTILHIAAKKGDTLKIGDLIAIVGQPGEDFSALLKTTGTTQAPAAQVQTNHHQTQAPATDTQPLTKATTTPAPSTDRIKASPLARTIAREKGIDLSTIQGSGEEGRIVKKDLENTSNGTTAPAPVFTGKESYRDVRISQMRKTIAKRLSESKYGAPHFYLTVDVNMDNAVSLRTQLNTILPQKISYNDIVLKAAALALHKHPNVNCSWLGDTIRYYQHVHIGMAVAVEDGLVVPVIKFAGAKTVQQIAAETKALAQKATGKKLLPDEMQGNTFTISNLGMFGIEEFTAIINSPDACILAVGAIRQEPGVVNGEIKAISKMKLTLSCDHRAVDGATGALFLKELKSLLENPVSVLL